MAIPVLSAERDVLPRHPVKRKRCIPGLVGIAGVLGEVWRASDGISPIDRRKQGEVTSGIVHRTASHRQGIDVFFEPEAVIRHPPREGLLAAVGGIVKT